MVAAWEGFGRGKLASIAERSTLPKADRGVKT